MDRRLGISLYPEHSDAQQDIEYIKRAKRYGFSRIFMCMLSATEGKERIKEKFSLVIGAAREEGFEVVLDIAPNIFDNLGISYHDLGFFYELGATGVRLDVGFDGNQEALLSFNEYDLKIELNMSNNVAYLDNIVTYKPNLPNIYGCHNFYPQKGTGLPYDFFGDCSLRFKQFGVRTAAFITSKNGNIGPWDINDGLCTLEEHRDMDIDVQAKHLFATGFIDDVIIGTAYATEEELRLLSVVNRHQVVFNVIPLDNTSELERKVMTAEQHYRRGDITSQMIRSTQVRVKYKDLEFPAHDNEQVFQRGDVVIGNDEFGKYKGELQIILEECRDSRKNLVGRIKDEELILLNYIEPWSKFRIHLQ